MNDGTRCSRIGKVICKIYRRKVAKRLTRRVVPELIANERQRGEREQITFERNWVVSPSLMIAEGRGPEGSCEGRTSNVLLFFRTDGRTTSERIDNPARYVLARVEGKRDEKTGQKTKKGVMKDREERRIERIVCTSKAKPTRECDIGRSLNSTRAIEQVGRGWTTLRDSIDEHNSWFDVLLISCPRSFSD